MDTEDFWEVIETARASAGGSRPFHEALVDHLAAFGEQGILDFQEKFYEVSGVLYRWDVWAAPPS